MTAVETGVCITPDELMRMPNAKDYELVDGQLLERNVSIDSSGIALTVGRLLGNEAARTGEARVFPPDLGYQCYPDDPGRVRRPDVSVVRRERLADIPGDGGYKPVPADLVVAVVSPNDTSYELVEKVREYLSAGFPLVCVIHPHVCTATVYRAGDATAITLQMTDEITAEPPLAAFFG